MAAPALLGYVGSTASVHDRIVGPLVAALGCIAVWEVTRGVRIANAALGAWLIAAGFLLGHPAVGVAWLGTSGVALLLLSLGGRGASRAYGGGWRSLLSQSRGLPAGSAGPLPSAGSHHV
jgi:hypothetical protein